MLRAYFYLAAAGAIWLIEGFLFSRYLEFTAWQSVLLGAVYLLLLAITSRALTRSLRRHRGKPTEMSTWRVVTAAPMLVVILGSFASLPLVLSVVALGKIL